MSGQQGIFTAELSPWQGALCNTSVTTRKHNNQLSQERRTERADMLKKKMIGKGAGSMKPQPAWFLWTGFKSLNLAFPEQAAPFLLHFPSLPLLLHILICGKQGCLQFYTHCLFRVTFIHVKHSYLCYKGTWYNIFEILWFVKKPIDWKHEVSLGCRLGGGMTCKLDWSHLKRKAFCHERRQPTGCEFRLLQFKKLGNKFVMCTK